MPTLTHELASTPLPNPLWPLPCLQSHSDLKICLHRCHLSCSPPAASSRYASEATPLPYASSHLLLTILALTQWLKDMPLIPPLPLLILSGPYHPYTHVVPSKYAFHATNPSLPSPSIQFSTPAVYHSYSPTEPSIYASDAANPSTFSPLPTPHLLYHSPFLCSCIRAIVYGGLLVHMMNPFTGIC
ncbi:hypothetical protein O181_015668 [Austropuccinia psidii MF-1]|uniref:Uncharacterized protein n=1 Tax=Austropuccinia psidii MF-1 TaxID=1389203 RepID=A0A9Q3C2W6_9BASI|nr:hypothetical protein [Austropuccinia psidii MF-1]